MAQQTKVLIAKPDRQNSVPLPMVKEKWTPCGKEKDFLLLWIVTWSPHAGCAAQCVHTRTKYVSVKK